jgi:hypothetical protein
MKKYFMMIVLFVPMMYMNLFSGETGLELTLRGGLTTIVTPYEHMDYHRLKGTTWDTVGLHSFTMGETYGVNVNVNVTKTIFITGDYSVGFDGTIQKYFRDKYGSYNRVRTYERLKVQNISIGIGSKMNFGDVKPYGSFSLTINKNDYNKNYFGRQELPVGCELTWPIMLDTSSHTSEIVVGGTISAGVIIPIGIGFGVDVRTSVNCNGIKLYNLERTYHFLTSGTVGINYEF